MHPVLMQSDFVYCNSIFSMHLYLLTVEIGLGAMQFLFITRKLILNEMNQTL